MGLGTDVGHFLPGSAFIIYGTIVLFVSIAPNLLSSRTKRIIEYILIGAVFIFGLLLFWIFKVMYFDEGALCYTSFDTAECYHTNGWHMSFGIYFMLSAMHKGLSLVLENMGVDIPELPMQGILFLIGGVTAMLHHEGFEYAVSHMEHVMFDYYNTTSTYPFKEALSMSIHAWFGACAIITGLFYILYWVSENENTKRKWLMLHGYMGCQIFTIWISASPVLLEFYAKNIISSLLVAFGCFIFNALYVFVMIIILAFIMKKTNSKVKDEDFELSMMKSSDFSGNF
eukprot:TRINITY_DN3080_c0_g1_i1.p1 TRINITY_DN3080_c0_g1~~TRINITY_DN3080_c0_g1_i1.p1  ORF type:complete len:285 (-),score=37.62 TRINITY_DN3080_c0_g1_i1:23-877(-)